jgi:hypothetical protein
MADNTTTPPPSLPEAVSVIHNTPVQHKKPRVVKTPKSRKAVKSPKLFATAPAQVTLTPSPPEVILNVPDTSVQSKKPRAIKTPKSRKAPRTPKTPATAPGQVPDVVDTPRTPATALAQALNAVVTLSLPEATVTPILIDGSPPSKPTVTLKKLEQLPILNEVIVRPSKSFTKLKKRMQNEEGWVGTQRGEIAEKSCHECSKGCGPFTLCCIVEGRSQISLYSTSPGDNVELLLKQRNRLGFDFG